MWELHTKSDIDLLAMMVGPRTARQLMRLSNGSLATLFLNETVATYEAEAKSQLKLRAARELVRRSLHEAHGQHQTSM